MWFVKPGEPLIEMRWGWEMGHSPGLITSKWHWKRCALHIAEKKTPEWMRLSPGMTGPAAVNINFCSVAHWGDWSVGKNCDWCLIRASQIPAESFCTGKICSKLIYWQNENRRRLRSGLPVTVIFLIFRFLYCWSRCPTQPPPPLRVPAR